MTEERSKEPQPGRQRPIVHEGAPADELDSNVNADDRVEVQGPDGKVVSPAKRKDERS